MSVPAPHAAALVTAFPAGILLAAASHARVLAAVAVAMAGCGAGLWVAVAGRGGLAITVTASALLLAAGFARGAGAAGTAGTVTGPVHFVGIVEEIDGSGLVVDAGDIAASADTTPAAGAVLVTTRPGGATGIGPGDRVEVQAGRLRAPGLRAGPRSAQSLERLGVDAIATSALVTRLGVGSLPLHMLGQLRAALGAAVNASLPAPSAALLLGVAFGWHGALDPAVRTDLQDAGLIHIVAVSGLKVVIVAAMVRALVSRLPIGRRQRDLSLLMAIAAYVALSGGGPAAVRSGLTAALGLMAAGDGRRRRPFAVLGLCAGVMLAISPRWLGDVGFQLSFLGTAGILLLADPLAGRVPGPRILVDPLAVTIAAQLATIPVMAANFQTISLVGPVANALVLPLLPLLIVLGWVGASCARAVPVFGTLLLQLAGIVIDGAVLVAHLLDRIPGAAIHIAEWPPIWTVAEIAGVGAALLVWHFRPSRRRVVGALT